MHLEKLKVQPSKVCEAQKVQNLIVPYRLI